MNDIDKEDIFNSMAFDYGPKTNFRTATKPMKELDREIKTKLRGMDQVSVKYPRKDDYRSTLSSILREKLFVLLGDKCIKCSCIDKRVLQFDHINGGGNKDRKARPGLTFYTFYLNNPDIAKLRLQVLCANCNWIKRSESGEARPKRLLKKRFVEI